jgi:serine protease Do
MRDQSMRARTMTARAIVSTLALVVLLFSSSVPAQDSSRVGLKIRTVTAELRKQNNLPDDTKGALVTAVAAGSTAQGTGIVAGEVIVEGDGKPVDTAKALATIISAASASGNSSVALKVMNGKGERRDVTLSIPKKSSGGSSPIIPGPK